MGAHVVTARLVLAGIRDDPPRLADAGPKSGYRTGLPPDVEQACRRLMRNLGIVSGCFDFIVTPEGEHVFLEVIRPASSSGRGGRAGAPAPRPLRRLPARARRDFRWQPEPDSPRHGDYYLPACARIAEGS